VFGATPTPTTTKSAGTVSPLSRLTPVTRPSSLVSAVTLTRSVGRCRACGAARLQASGEVVAVIRVEVNGEVAQHRGLDKLGDVHQRHSQWATQARGVDPANVLPGVHRVATLVKRWLLGTHRDATK